MPEKVQRIDIEVKYFQSKGAPILSALSATANPAVAGNIFSLWECPAYVGLEPSHCWALDNQNGIKLLRGSWPRRRNNGSRPFKEFLGRI